MYVKLLDLIRNVTAAGAAAAASDHEARLVADMGLDQGQGAATGAQPRKAARKAPAGADLPGVDRAAMAYAPVFRLAL